MGNDASKWLMGCGIGCAALIVIVVLVGLGSFMLVKDTFEDFEDMGRTVSEVREEFGAPGSFVPEPSGTLTPERVEAFLQVREATLPIREEITESIRSVMSSIDTMENEGGSFVGVLNIIRAGAGALPKVAAFHKVRAQALLDEKMGMGEYGYLYVLTFYSWLGKSPSDGPPFTLVGRDENHDDSETEEEVRARRRRLIQKRVRRLFISILGNGAESCRQPDAGASDEWCEALEEELKLLQGDSGRIPWQEGVPSNLEESLAVYRGELDASYSELVNPLELMESIND